MMEKELPKGWVEITMGDYFKIERGGSPRPIKDYLTTDEDGVNWIKISDATTSNKYIYQTREKIRPEGVKKSRLVFENDFLLSNSMSFGRPYIMKTEGCIHDGWLVIRKSEIVNPDLLYYVLSSNLAYAQFSDLAKGSTVKNLNIQAAQKVIIPLPPLPEQKRIVAKLDALFGHLDVLREKLDRIPELLKNFRQQVLTQAVTGRLTEEWRKGNELDSEFFNLIDTTHAEKDRPVKVRGKKGFDDNLNLYNVPKNWKWIPNYKLVSNGGNAICAGPFGTIFKAKDFRTEGIPIIFLRHVKPDGFNQNKPNYMDPKVWKEFHQEYSVYGGELLVTKLGDPPGDAAIFPKNFGMAMVTPDVMKASYNEELLSTTYASYFFNSSACKDLISEVSFGMTRLRIDLTMFKSFPIPVPTPAEQSEIVKRVESLFTSADKIEAQYQSLKEKIDQLPQAILAKAFKGELVAQDKNDEPAGVLLEQIKGNKSGKGSKKAYKQGERLGMVAEEEKEHNK